MELAQQTCNAAVGKTLLSGREVQGLLVQVPGWSLADREIKREFTFKNFRDAMDFVNKVASIANEQDHHPDIGISYNRVSLVLTTHKIGGLSLNDFILAARINLLADREAGARAA